MQYENGNRCFLRKDNCKPQKGRIQKYIARLLEEFQSRLEHLEELKTCSEFLVYLFNVNVAGAANRLSQTCVL